MKNIMTINGVKAVISFEPDIEMFRGEFIGLNGGADFMATSIKQLTKEGEISLKVFIEMCEKENITPYKNYSGKFNVRVSPHLHHRAVVAAQAENASLNTIIDKAIVNYLDH